MADSIGDLKVIESLRLPYGGNVEMAHQLGDRRSERKILSYRSNRDIFPSLPDVRVDKGKCELEIEYLDRDGIVENSLCSRRKDVKLNNEQSVRGLSVYSYNSIYHMNIEALNDRKVVAIPVLLKPKVYYLVKKKRYIKDKVSTFYSVYSSLYWDKHGVSTTFLYSSFERLTDKEMIENILSINKE